MFVFALVEPVDSFFSVEGVIFSSFLVGFVSSFFSDLSVVSEIKKYKDQYNYDRDEQKEVC
jgi:hypothetical protein